MSVYMISPKRALPLGLITVFALASCNAPRLPIEITGVTSSQPPVVGKLVNLFIEVRSIGDEPNVRVTLSLPPTIYSPEEEMDWQLDLSDDDPITLSTEICVLEEGKWFVDVGIASYFDDGEFKYGDLSAIGVVSSENSAQLLLEKDITFNQAEQTQNAPKVPARVNPSDCVKP